MLWLAVIPFAALSSGQAKKQHPLCSYFNCFTVLLQNILSVTLASWGYHNNVSCHYLNLPQGICFYSYN